MKENIYNHIFDPLHILKLQENFIRKQNQNTNEKILQKIENKKQQSLIQQIKQEQIVQEVQKQQTNDISFIDQDQNQNRINNCLENFIESLQFDLKQIGKIQLSLIVSILVKTYCTISDLLEMKFSQIQDKNNFYYLKIKNSWKKSVLILKSGFPDYLQDLIRKNAGSNKPLMKLLGQNKRQYLSKQLWIGCQQISIQTKDVEYMNFLQGLNLKNLKRLAIERLIKRNPTYINIQSTSGDKNQQTQSKIKVQEIQTIEQTMNLEKKQVIKIKIIKEKQNKFLNEKQEIVQ
ncbi:unnamed protein product [Paramecium sonneborni]|uniref:Uncharacterized protein n=1 Tax=Paramecium sonneborni TaxID=65129 RepID=A0A8S1KVR6_9CILI|nr:unnamed protein product [Paramecium sonneborni]